MPHLDPKLNQGNATPSKDDEPASDLLFDPQVADRNVLHKDDPSIATDVPFEENSATDGDGQ